MIDLNLARSTFKQKKTLCVEIVGLTNIYVQTTDYRNMKWSNFIVVTRKKLLELS